MTATSVTEEPCETPAAVAPHAAAQASRQGVICGVLSYGCWGLMPLYFKLVSAVAAGEVVAQRVFWSFVLLAVVVTVLGRWTDLVAAMRSRQILLALAASTLLLAFNWFTYIYAVSTNQVVEASLGYFLNPLVNVVIGVALLGERLRPWQLVSVVLAGAGVVILGVPPIAVTLAVSFALLRPAAQDRGRRRAAWGCSSRPFCSRRWRWPTSCICTWSAARHSCSTIRRTVRNAGGQRHRDRGAVAVVRRGGAAAALLDAGLLAIPGAHRCSFCWPCCVFDEVHARRSSGPPCR